MEAYLTNMADIAGADFFIDCLLDDEPQAVLVVAEAFPTTARSLYRNSVVGQLALAENEPGVLACLRTGAPVLGSRGVSQEGIAIEQRIIPIKNAASRTIGALIMEKDISDSVSREKHMEFLAETTEQLSFTLMQFAFSENQLPALMDEGIVLFDEAGIVSFANANAAELFRKLGFSSLKGTSVETFAGIPTLEEIKSAGGARVEELERGPLCVQVKAVSFLRHGRVGGGMLLLRDISDLRAKEKQLLLQTAVIKEIHHRVKNNLQTISSLLNLQARRCSTLEARNALWNSMQRINSISLVHEMLAREGQQQADCLRILEDLTGLMTSTLASPDQDIRIVLEGELLLLASDQSTSLVLIVNELVQNSLTHAFAGASVGVIRIGLHRLDGWARLIVEDSGPGFKESSGSAGSLGLQIVRMLAVEGLGGTLRLSEAGKPCRIEVTFPHPAGEGPR